MNLQNAKTLFKRMEKEIDPQLTALQKLWIYLDYRVERKRTGISFLDYTQYQFYWRNHRGREKFISSKKAREIVKICNVWESCLGKFGDKAAFNRIFQKYLHREWLFTDSCLEEEFIEFASSRERFFIKPVDKSYGIGTDVIVSRDVEDYHVFYEELKRSKTLVEELIDQHPDFAAFNASSVNSVRVVTLRCADDSVRVMGGVLRVGRAGKVADNFHHHGICALIDVETGIVNTQGIDKDNKKYTIHPDSKKAIVGFQIPCWDKIIAMTTEAARIVPEVRFVGWDVTVDVNDNAVIIEGNSTPMHDVTQIPDQIGKWADYEPLIQALAENAHPER